MSENENVAYISPDNDIMPTGHLETTTGASLVRNPVKSTSPLDGREIGVAVLVSDGRATAMQALFGDNTSCMFPAP